MGTVAKPGIVVRPSPEFEIDDEVAHEADFGSEDLDFQPEEFTTQHFHRVGWLWPWLIMGFSGLLYCIGELLYQKAPDHLTYRKPHPYHLGHPDSAMHELQVRRLTHPEEFQDMYDAGIGGD